MRQKEQKKARSRQRAIPIRFTRDQKTMPVPYIYFSQFSRPIPFLRGPHGGG